MKKLLAFLFTLALATCSQDECFAQSSGTSPVMKTNSSATVIGPLSLSPTVLTLSGTVTGSAGIIPASLVSGGGSGTVLSLTLSPTVPIYGSVTNPTTTPLLTLSLDSNLVNLASTAGKTGYLYMFNGVEGFLPTVPAAGVTGVAFTLAGPNTATGSNTFSGSNSFSGTVTGSGFLNVTGSLSAYQFTTNSASQQIWIDATTGNDTTGAVGQRNRPFLTLGAATAAASTTSPTVFNLSPGSFTTSTTTNLYSGWWLNGAGVNSTIVTKGNGVNNYGIYSASGSSDMAITNLTWKGNNANNTWTLTTSPVAGWDFGEEWMFWMPLRLRIENVQVVNATKYAIHILAPTYLWTSNLAFSFSSPIVNQDGIHVQAPTHWVGAGFTGTTGDDAVAITTAEGPTSYSSDVWPSGNATDVNLKGIDVNSVNASELRLDVDTTTTSMTDIKADGMVGQNAIAPPVAIGFNNSSVGDVNGIDLGHVSNTTTISGYGLIAIYEQINGTIHVHDIFDNNTGPGHAVVTSGNYFVHNISYDNISIINNSSDGNGVTLYNMAFSSAVLGNMEVGHWSYWPGTSSDQKGTLFQAASGSSPFGNIFIHDGVGRGMDSLLKYTGSGGSGLDVFVSNVSLSAMQNAVVNTLTNSNLGLVEFSDVSSTTALANNTSGTLTLAAVNCYSTSAPFGKLLNGAVTQVSNSDGTLTITNTTSTAVASLNLAHANTWTANQTISSSAPLSLVSPTQTSIAFNTSTNSGGFAIGRSISAGNANDFFIFNNVSFVTDLDISNADFATWHTVGNLFSSATSFSGTVTDSSMEITSANDSEINFIATNSTASATNYNLNMYAHAVSGVGIYDWRVLNNTLSSVTWQPMSINLNTQTWTMSGSGGLTFNGAITATGAGTIGGALTVTGSSTQQTLSATNLTASAASTASSTLNVGGTLTGVNEVLTGASLSATTTFAIGFPQIASNAGNTNSTAFLTTITYANITGIGASNYLQVWAGNYGSTGTTAAANVNVETYSISSTGPAFWKSYPGGMTFTASTILLEGTTLTLSPFTNVYDTATTTTFNGTTVTGSAAVNLSGATTLSGVTKLTNSVILGTNTFSNTATASTNSGATFVISGTTFTDSSTTNAIGGTTLTVSSTNVTMSGTVTLSGTSHTNTISLGVNGTSFYDMILATVSPSSGLATVTNAAITVNTVPVITVLTQAGTTTQAPYPTMHAGSMSFTVTATDTSTYSVLLLVK